MPSTSALWASLVDVWAPPELLSTTTGAPSSPPRISDDTLAGPDGGASVPVSSPGETVTPSVVSDEVVEVVDDVDDPEGPSVAGDDSPVDGDSELDSAGRADAMPGVVATAAPTPRATARAPT
jgi:hypothetical protein